ncbi:DUF6174 domain-containing protein [Porticoccus sp. W117]|uniref:DUF6174 domain-containing protein n=1 Tax=Porticoccus sp. W117 TaxID=3054777 RepID=UPI00259448BE|nr:DUF6174 domain-containing protein [Porticoccus sp. W117]MDM3871309.1 DUF6174 domain-containing protein [Porticoccus sp. W117]
MKYLTYLLASLFLAGCVGGDLHSDNQAVQPVAPLSPLQQWQALSFSDYDYDVQRSCFCTQEYVRPMRVSVRAGKVVDAVYLDDDGKVHEEVQGSLRTIDQWFAYITKGKEKPFHRLEVSYHPEQGYPTSIDADVRSRIADDEQQLVLKNLTPR